MLFSDLAGDITPQVEHLKAFIANWYQPEDTVSLVAIPSEEFDMTTNRFGKAARRRQVLSQALTVEELMEATVSDISSLTESNGVQHNLYIGINPLKSAESVSLHSRGNETEIRGIYGVFIDFDIKSGCFESKDDIQRFLNKFGHEILAPTIIVDNSESGGVHAYWRFAFGEELQEEEAREILLDWWSLVSEHAKKWNNGVEIDRLVDLTRVSRMPGGIYWPRKEPMSNKTVGKPGVVKVAVIGHTHSIEAIRAASEGAGIRYRETIKRVRAEDEARRISANDIARNLTGFKAGTSIGGYWGLYAAIAYIEDLFNDTYSWEEILIPHGWTFLYEDREGRVLVARPGRHEKSATVGWEGSPNMMSLLSTSPETGLDDLKEAGIALTKWRVALRLNWKDDENKMIQDVLASVPGKW